MAAGKLRRYVMVKFRQFGGSTLEIALSDYLTGTFPGQYAATIAHDLPTTVKLFDIANRYYEGVAARKNCFPSSNGKPPTKPMYHWQRDRQNKRTLEYSEADAKHFIGTAGNRNFGHGLTLQKTHLSEASRFPDLRESLAALEGVPVSGEIMLESTPFGATGKFYELAQEAFRGENEYTLIFFVWYKFLKYQLPTTAEEAQTIHAEIATGSHAQFGNEEQALAQRLAHEGIVLTAGQWKWRRWKRRDLKEKFFEQYPEDFVSCWLASGRPVFDTLRIMATPTFTPIRKLEGDSLWIYEDPIPGRRYILWSDPSEGIEREGAAEDNKTDYSTFGILDADTGEDCAVFEARVRPAELARLIDKWGREYNDALAGVERNNHGHAVLLSLMDVHGYPNLYHHSDILDASGKTESRPGWPTNKATRPAMIDQLDTVMREGMYVPKDDRMRQQMCVFMFSPDGKAEAASGNHDDLVLGRAIGEAIRSIPRALTMESQYV